jgi:chorismate mutase
MGHVKASRATKLGRGSKMIATAVRDDLDTATLRAAIDALDSEAVGNALDSEAVGAALDDLDREIVELVRRRTELTRTAGLARINAGLPRTAQHSEMGAVRRYESELGREGVGLAILLMRLGRSGVPQT